MLVRLGKLPDREAFSDIEIDRAVTAFLFEQAGDKKFSRVENIMRQRWHGAGNSGALR